MKSQEFTFQAKTWRHPGHAGWHFITVPKNLSKQLTELFGDMKAGWGSLPVNVTVGATTWETSIFPDKPKGIYLLPIKKEVRKKEGISDETTIQISLTIRL